jgi:hypothetical protein
VDLLKEKNKYYDFHLFFGPPWPREEQQLFLPPASVPFHFSGSRLLLLRVLLELCSGFYLSTPVAAATLPPLLARQFYDPTLRAPPAAADDLNGHDSRLTALAPTHQAGRKTDSLFNLVEGRSFFFVSL